MLPIYAANKDNLKFAHININSIRHKFIPLAETMQKGIIDVLSIQETKLDNSFPRQQFHCEDFKMYRKDYKCNAGGLLFYIRNDLTQRRRADLEFDQNHNNTRVESLCIEVYIKSEKWILCSVYKQPNMSDLNFKGIFENVLKTISQDCTNFIFMGDFNINMLHPTNCLKDILSIYGCKNIVTHPTCHKGNTASLIDLIITNVPKRIKNVKCLEIGLSDFHDMVFFSTKQHVPKRSNKYITYRSYKNFNVETYKDDLQQIPFHVAEIFDDIDDMYFFQQNLLLEVMDKHAPLKQRMIKHNNVPYMNGELRKAINVKNMLKRKYDRCSTTANRELYRKQRNITVRLRKKSLNVYMQQNCNVNKNSQQFWKTVKPLISDKYCKHDNITLMEHNDVINEPGEVSNVLNEYFINMAADIGQQNNIEHTDDVRNIISDYVNHESIVRIRANQQTGAQFDFDQVSAGEILNEMLKINIKKSTGYDKIPAKLLKYGRMITWTKQITDQSVFYRQFLSYLREC